MLKRKWFFVAATSILTHSAFGDIAELSFEEMRQRCHEQEASAPAPAFTAMVSCHETRSFWVRKAARSFPLANESKIRLKAQILNGSQETAWQDLKGPIADSGARCDVLEEWSETARTTSTLNCNELNAITNEAAYCQTQLQSVWDKYKLQRERILVGIETKETLSHKDELYSAANTCVFAPTGVVKGCGEPAAAPDANSNSSSVTVHIPKDESTSSVTLSTSDAKEQARRRWYEAFRNRDNIAAAAGPEYKADPWELGAAVKAAETELHFLAKHHQVVQLHENPLPGSLLAQCGFKIGDSISRVGKRRVKTPKELRQALESSLNDPKASKKGFKIKYKKAGGKFIEKIIRPNFS